MLTSLSRRGAFIETSDAYTIGDPIRVEFKIEGRPISLFANVTRVDSGGSRQGEALPPGIDVIFYEVDHITDAAISDAVEALWMRYRP